MMCSLLKKRKSSGHQPGQSGGLVEKCISFGETTTCLILLTAQGERLAENLGLTDWPKKSLANFDEGKNISTSGETQMGDSTR